MRGAAEAAHGASFTGAVLPLCGEEVLIVVVREHVMSDVHEANAYVSAFNLRFRRTIVLMAQNAAGTPRYYGPGHILRAIGSLPFAVLPWQRIYFRVEKPAAWMLPVAPARSGNDSSSASRSSGGSMESLSSDALSLVDDDDLTQTTIREPASRDRARAEATTRVLAKPTPPNAGGGSSGSGGAPYGSGGAPDVSGGAPNASGSGPAARGSARDASGSTREASGRGRSETRVLQPR